LLATSIEPGRRHRRTAHCRFGAHCRAGSETTKRSAGARRRAEAHGGPSEAEAGLDGGTTVSFGREGLTSPCSSSASLRNLSTAATSLRSARSIGSDIAHFPLVRLACRKSLTSRHGRFLQGAARESAN